MSTALVVLHIAAGPAEHGALAALLEAAGALALTTRSAGGEVLEPDPGAAPLWPQLVVSAYFPAGQDLAPLRALLAARGLAVQGPVRVPARDWVRTTARVPARRYGQRLWVAPPGVPVPEAAAVVRLTPGLGFGTGTHPTTALCLRWLDAHPPAGARVLDYGCGSGILALAAAHLGARAVWAVDHDPQARRSARENAAANGLGAVVRVGSAAPARGRFEVVVANILLPVLVALAPRLHAHLAGGGRLLLSGVLDSQLPALRAAYAPYLRAVRVYRRSGWAALAGERRDD